MCKRSIRRHHSERMKAKARKVAQQSWGYRVDLGMAAAEVERLSSRAEKFSDHLASCSCYMCGNPRKWFEERTRAEEKWRINASEQEREM